MRKVLLTMVLVFVAMSATLAQTRTFKSEYMVGYTVLGADYNNEDSLIHIQTYKTVTSFGFNTESNTITMLQDGKSTTFKVLDSHQNKDKTEYHYVVDVNDYGQATVEVIYDGDCFRLWFKTESLIVSFPYIKEIENKNTGNWKTI
jgi:hypothetical protein